MNNYKGLYYRYDTITDTWVILDRPDETGWKFVYSASIYRIDQALELAQEELNKDKNDKALISTRNQYPSSTKESYKPTNGV